MSAEPPPLPEEELEALLGNLAPQLDPETYVFVTRDEDAIEPALLASARLLFREAEGLTLVVPTTIAARHGLAVREPQRRITFSVYSSLAAVGLTAAVSTALAAAGIPANMVAAYHHDHVFVPAARADEALSVLSRLMGAAAPAID